MKLSIGTVVISLIGIFTLCEAGLQVDLIDPAGLQYYKNNNYSNPGASQAILDSIKSSATGSVNNPSTYSVTNTSQIPPNGDKHKYYSWAPYSWPDCSGISTVIDEMHQCPYKGQDGQFVPDLSKISDPKDSASLVKDVTTLAVTYSIMGGDQYAQRAARLLQVWFLNNDTYMTPDVDYGQVVRGPKNWTGRVEGVLDLRLFVFIPPAVDILKGSSAWSSSLTDGMQKWFTNYSTWLQNSQIGQGARDAANNHGSFYTVQLATYLSWVGQTDGAIAAINRFLDNPNQFQKQIAANGDQPFESGRTRPYHYRCFNLVALTYLARLSNKIGGRNMWESKTAAGSTIKDAINFIVDAPFPAKENTVSCLVPLYAARQYYGDPDGKWNSYLSKVLAGAKTNDRYWQTWAPTALEGIADKSSGGAKSSANSVQGGILTMILMGIIVGAMLYIF